MRICRTLPPAAAPIPLHEVLKGFSAVFARNENGYEQFQSELQSYFGRNYCFLVSSGRAALTLILQALKQLYPGRTEVLIPAFTCFSVPAAIMKAGLEIRLCDIDQQTLDFNHSELKKIIASEKGSNLLCVLATHLFGYPADIASLRETIGNEIPIVEDAAQALGGENAGVKLGILADVGFFSLGRGKALSTVEGGVILTNRRDMGKTLASLVEKQPGYGTAEKVKLAIKALLITILQQPFLFRLPLSLPFLQLGETLFEHDFPILKMSPVQAALSRNWQERLRKHQNARKKNTKYWAGKLQLSCGLWCRTQQGNCGNLIRFPVLAANGETREAIVRESRRKGLGIMPSYPTPINEIAELAANFAGQSYPAASEVCKKIFTLPLHDYVTSMDNQRICRMLVRRGVIKGS